MKDICKFIVFDLDDTLYEEFSYVTSGFHQVSKYLSQHYGLDDTQIFNEMQDLLKKNGRGRIFDDILLNHSLYSQELVSALVTEYRGHRPDIQLYPDVLPVLESIRDQQCPLGIITDGLHIMQKQKITALNLEPHVDFVIYTDELGSGCSKPHPAGFLLSLNTSMSSQKNSYFVGNDSIKDILGAKSVGMNAIHISRNSQCRNSLCEADGHIKTLYDLNRIINFVGKRI